MSRRTGAQRKQILRLEELRGLIDATTPQRDAFKHENQRLSDELEQATRAAEELRDACTAAEGDAERTRLVDEQETKPKLAAAQKRLNELTQERAELTRLGALSTTVTEAQMRINMREKHLLEQLEAVRREMEVQQTRLRKLRAPHTLQAKELKQELEFLRFSASQASEHALRSSLLKTMEAAKVKQARLQQYAAKLQADKEAAEGAIIKAMAEHNLLAQHLPAAEQGIVSSGALKLLRAPVTAPPPPPAPGTPGAPAVPPPPPPPPTAAASVKAQAAAPAAPATPVSVASSTGDKGRFSSFLRLAGLGTTSPLGSPASASTPRTPASTAAPKHSPLAVPGGHVLANGGNTPLVSSPLTRGGPTVAPAGGRQGLQRHHATPLSPLMLDDEAVLEEVEEPLKPVAGHSHRSSLQGAWHGYNSPRQKRKEAAARQARLEKYEQVRRKPQVTYWVPSSTLSPVKNRVPSKFVPKKKKKQEAEAAAAAAAAAAAPGGGALAKLRAAAKNVGVMSAFAKRAQRSGLDLRLVALLRQKLRAAAYTAGGKNYKKLFKYYDRDNSGTLEFEEFRSALRRDAKISKQDVSDLSLRKVFRAVDADGGGEIDVDEFIAWIKADDPIPDTTLSPDRRRPTSPRRRKQPTNGAGGAGAAEAGGSSGTSGGSMLAAMIGMAMSAKVAAKKIKRSYGLDPELVSLLKRKLRAAAYTAGGKDFKKLFKHYDRDNSGTLEFDEFRSALRRDAKIAKKDVSDAQLAKVFRAVDEDGGGEIDVDEFIAWVEEDDEDNSAGSDAPRGGLFRGTYSQRIKARIPLRARQAAAARATLAIRNTKKLAPEVMAAVKRKLVAAVERVGGLDYNKLFALYDHSGIGELDFEQFKTALRNEGGISRDVIANRELKALFDAVDADHSGTVDKDEFAQFLDPDGARSPRKGRSPIKRASSSRGFGSGRPAKSMPRAASSPALSARSVSSPSRQAARESAKLAGLRAQLRAAAFAAGGVNWGKLFRRYDRDETAPPLDEQEFVRALREDGSIAAADIEDSDLRTIFVAVADGGGSTGAGDGSIRAKAFVDWVRKADVPAAVVEEANNGSDAGAGASGDDSSDDDDDDDGAQPVERATVQLADVMARLGGGGGSGGASPARPRPVLTAAQQASLRSRVRAAVSSVGGLDLRLALLGDATSDTPVMVLPYEGLRERLRDLRVRKTDVSREDLEVAFGVVDVEGTGLVNVDTFIRWVDGEDVSNGVGNGAPAAEPAVAAAPSPASLAMAAFRAGSGGGVGGSSSPGRSPRRRSSVMAPTQSQLARMRANNRNTAKPVPTILEASSLTQSSSMAKLRKAAKAVSGATKLRRKKTRVDPAVVKKVKQKLRACSYTTGGMDFGRLFKHYDRDNSGSLEFDEFRSALRRDAKIKPSDVSDRDLLTVFSAVDEDGGGEVEIDEFVAWLESRDDEEAVSSPAASRSSPSPRRASTRRRSSVMAPTRSQLNRQRGNKRGGAKSTLSSVAESSGGAMAKLRKAAKAVSGATKLRRKKTRVDPAVVKKVKQKLRACSYTTGGMDFGRLFKHYDRDNSGSLEFDEFRSALRRDAKIKPSDVSDRDLLTVFSAVDEDGGGEVEIDEFVAWLESRDDEGEAVSTSNGSAARRGGSSGKSPATRRRQPPATPPASSPTAAAKSNIAKLRRGMKAVASATRLKQKKAMRVDPAVVKKVKQKLRACSYTTGGMDFGRLFKHYDRDNSGSLEFDEFRSALRRDAKIKPSDVSDRDLLTVFSAVDEDGGGEVEIDEFVAWLEESDTVPDGPMASPTSRPSPGRGPRRRGSVMAMTQSRMGKMASSVSARQAAKAARLAALKASMG